MIVFLFGSYFNICRVVGGGWGRAYAIFLCNIFEWSRDIKNIGEHWSRIINRATESQ